MKLILALAIFAIVAGCDQNKANNSDGPIVGKGHNLDRVYDPTNGIEPTPIAQTETVL